MSQEIHSKTASYAVLQLVGKTSEYNVYIVSDHEGNEYLLKIASDTGCNGLLDREAFLLREIHEEITLREQAYKANGGTDQSLGYKRCFPSLQDSFLVPEQGNRRVNLIAIYGAESMKDLVPIEQWRIRERVRIDPKSSAWIMGRLLKIFTLTHSFGIEICKVDGGNILANPKNHHVAIFDWTKARHHDGSLPKKVARQEIAAAATQIVLALGGDPVMGSLPESDQLADSRYADFLKAMIDGKYSDAFKTGSKFYQLLDDLWESSFHPFTTIQI